MGGIVKKYNNKTHAVQCGEIYFSCKRWRVIALGGELSGLANWYDVVDCIYRFYTVAEIRFTH